MSEFGEEKDDRWVTDERYLGVPAYRYIEGGALSKFMQTSAIIFLILFLTPWLMARGITIWSWTFIGQAGMPAVAKWLFIYPLIAAVVLFALKEAPPRVRAIGLIAVGAALFITGGSVGANFLAGGRGAKFEVLAWLKSVGVIACITLCAGALALASLNRVKASWVAPVAACAGLVLLLALIPQEQSLGLTRRGGFGPKQSEFVSVLKMITDSGPAGLKLIGLIQLIGYACVAFSPYAVYAVASRKGETNGVRSLARVAGPFLGLQGVWAVLAAFVLVASVPGGQIAPLMLLLVKFLALILFSSLCLHLGIVAFGLQEKGTDPTTDRASLGEIFE